MRTGEDRIVSKYLYFPMYLGGKWRWLENFEYLGKISSNFRNKLKWYIDGSHSKLMGVLDEYETITKSSLYRKDNFWFFEPKNEFEEKLYFSKKMNQKEIIEMIQEEIQRIKHS